MEALGAYRSDSDDSETEDEGKRSEPSQQPRSQPQKQQIAAAAVQSAAVLASLQKGKRVQAAPNVAGAGPGSVSL